MKYALIDVGSNSMRLSAYEVRGTQFQILFKEKLMAGLAGYVEENRLTKEGMENAAAGISYFLEIVAALGITEYDVFATASLRNIENTKEALGRISSRTGCTLTVLTGKEEAQYGYYGAMHELQRRDGVFVDIGGGSTEVVQFTDGEIIAAKSYPIGSLRLYSDCVKKILPGKKSRKRIEEKIMQELLFGEGVPFIKCRTLVGVGGTVRAALELCRRQFALPADAGRFGAKQLELLCTQLYAKEKKAAAMILKAVPERIHTLVPGLMILQKIVQMTKAQEIAVSRYGVREGYLCRKIQDGTL